MTTVTVELVLFGKQVPWWDTVTVQQDGPVICVTVSNCRDTPLGVRIYHRKEMSLIWNRQVMNSDTDIRLLRK